MKDRRGLRGNQKWRKEVKERDKCACRRCNVGVGYDLHAHHIKHREKYPEFALVLENGLTLCEECHKTWHRLLKGKEERPDLRAFMQGFMSDDAKIDWQLRAIEGKFTRYLQRKLESEFRCIREEGVLELFRHLDDYPNSLSEMVQLLVFVVYNYTCTNQARAIEYLKQAAEEIEVIPCQNVSCKNEFRIPVRKNGTRFDCAICCTSFEYHLGQSGATLVRSPHPAAAKAKRWYERCIAAKQRRDGDEKPINEKRSNRKNC